MKRIAIRLFILLPLLIIWLLLLVTVIIPVVYWILSGDLWVEDPLDWILCLDE